MRRLVVPRTIESSQKTIRCPWMMEGMGMSFISAIMLRSAWLVGMKLRGQVGVYFTNGRP